VPRPITIRQSLIRSFAPLVLTVALAGVVILIITGRFAVRTLSAALIEQTHARVEERLDAFFEPILIEMRELTLDLREGELDPAEDAEVRRRARRVISSVPHAAAMLLADHEGREVMVLRLGDEWLSHTIPAGGEPGTIVRWNRGDPTPRPEPGPDGYDARTRPWFTGAAAAAPDPEIDGASVLHWTEPYTFFTSELPGVTLSRRVTPPSGDDHVVAIDVLLHDLDRFTRSLTIQRGGRVYLTDGQGRIIGLPADPAFADSEARAELALEPLASIGHALSADAAGAYADILAQRGLSQWDKPFRFESGGQSYWAQTERYTLAGGLTLAPAVVVSEKDLLGPILTARWIALALAVAAVAWALWRCLAIAARFSSPIRALAEESDRISKGAATLDHRPLTSSVLELARLSESQVEMRHAMKTLGKMERDLQVAREIQQALLPREINAPTGWSIAGWSDPADETGGDIYDVASNGGKVYLFLADATGHGVGPAISAAQVRAMMRMALRAGASNAATFAALNDQLREDLPAGRFVTLWAGCLGESPGGVLTLDTFSAGQAPLLYYHAAEDRFDQRDAMVPPLGVLDTLDADHAAVSDTPRPGDFYAVFSDGIYEARSPGGELFGAQRVKDALRDAATGSAQDLIDAVRRAVDRFAAGELAADDRTGVVVKRDG